MNYLTELKWVKEGEKNALLVSGFCKAPCDLLITPKDSRIEYKIDFQNNPIINGTKFLHNEGYVIPRGWEYSLQVKYNDTDTAPDLDELAELGFSIKPQVPNQCVDIWDAPIGAFSLTPYFCGLKIAKTIKENMKPISPFGEYGHQSMTVLKNGKGYSIFTANNTTMKEYDCYTFARFAVYDIDEPEKAKFYTVAAMGENGSITIDGVASLTSLVDTGENIICHCYGFVDGVITEFRRVFDVEKEQFHELEVCKLIHDGKEYDFTNKNIAKLFGAEYGLTVINTEMGIGPHFEYNDEWYTWLYTGSSRFAGILLKTRDFLKFEFVMVPEECRGTKCEITPHFFKGYMYVAFRRDYEMQRLEVVKYDMRTLKPVESIVLKDTAMRPYFYEYKDELYLIHSPHARMYTSIVKLSTERRFLMSRSVASIENMHICTPCAVMYKGELYLTFSSRQGSYSQIFITHFSPEMPYTEEQVNNALLGFIEKETE